MINVLCTYIFVTISSETNMFQSFFNSDASHITTACIV